VDAGREPRETALTSEIACVAVGAHWAKALDVKRKSSKPAGGYNFKMRRRDIEFSFFNSKCEANLGKERAWRHSSTSGRND
jgi:hypothetical protein